MKHLALLTCIRQESYSFLLVVDDSLGKHVVVSTLVAEAVADD